MRQETNFLCSSHFLLLFPKVHISDSIDPENIKPTLWPENRIQIDSLDSHQHGTKIMGLDEITQSIL